MGAAAGKKLCVWASRNMLFLLLTMWHSLSLHASRSSYSTVCILHDVFITFNASSSHCASMAMGDTHPLHLIF
jgi:hypothetical protein